MLQQVLERALQVLPGTRQERLHGGDRGAQGVGDVLVALAVEAGEYEGQALLLGQGVDGRLDAAPDLLVLEPVGHFLGARADAGVGATVAGYARFVPRYLPLPHPSPRNIAWFKRNPWFDDALLPTLRSRVRCLFGEPTGVFR